VPKKQKARKHPTASKRTSSPKAATGSTANPSKWIRIDQTFPLPVYVKEALQKLDEAGHIAYVVGGCVRDFLLHRATKDYDIATSADPDELCRLFPTALTIGKSFGVIKVPLSLPDGKTVTLEIATFRQDLEYRDHRHPSGVLFSGPAEDARRRDFSINALFFDPKTQRILDTVEGFADISGRIIRAIGNPSRRFEEDALRLLRAVRFSSRLDFLIEPHTYEAIRKHSKLIKKVSAERVRDELTGMLTGPRPGLALRMLSDLGLLPCVLTELETLKGVEQPPIFQFEGDVWQYTLKVLDTLAKFMPIRPGFLCWATLLHEVGKPQALRHNEGKNFNGHEIIGSGIAKSICDRMKMPRADVQVIQDLIEDQLKFKSVFEMRESTLQRWLMEPHFKYSLILHRATAMVSDGNLAFFEFCDSRLRELEAHGKQGDSHKLLDGEDLIQMGLSPGPHFAKILRSIEDLAMERKLQTKEQALEYVLKNFVK
jgi:tRNA nucleotidyltransferase/poly(A) polymerase